MVCVAGLAPPFFARSAQPATCCGKLRSEWWQPPAPAAVHLGLQIHSMFCSCLQVVVATPGRLWELMRGGHAHLTALGGLRFLVLDEADRMVQKGHFQVTPCMCGVARRLRSLEP